MIRLVRNSMVVDNLIIPFYSLCLFSVQHSTSESFVYKYEPSTAGWLDTGRLKVPYWRDIVELLNLIVLTISYIVCINQKNLNHINTSEVVFIAVSLGLTLDEVSATHCSMRLGARHFLTNGFLACSVRSN